MDPLTIIQEFYPPGTKLYHTLVDHSRQVTQKSLEIADAVPHMMPDRNFLEKAAMLHDIGIFLTDAPSIGCSGDKPYICHGWLGRQALDKLNLPREYGLVCERHTGAGISKKNIHTNNLPLPLRDMIPVSLEEKIICVADKYFSKSPRQKQKTLTTAQVIQNLEKIDIGHAKRFTGWAKDFDLLP